MYQCLEQMENGDPCIHPCRLTTENSVWSQTTLQEILVENLGEVPLKPSDLTSSSTANRAVFFYHQVSEAQKQKPTVLWIFKELETEQDKVWEKELLFLSNKIPLEGKSLSIQIKTRNGRGCNFFHCLQVLWNRRSFSNCLGISFTSCLSPFQFRFFRQ